VSTVVCVELCDSSSCQLGGVSVVVSLSNPQQRTKKQRNGRFDCCKCVGFCVASSEVCDDLSIDRVKLKKPSSASKCRLVWKDMSFATSKDKCYADIRR
jgi:hypothetical protein